MFHVIARWGELGEAQGSGVGTGTECVVLYVNGSESTAIDILILEAVLGVDIYTFH